MQTKSQIDALLAEAGHHPDRRFGQNFLIDLNQMQRVLDLAGLTGSETVLEVGPGTGSLTEELLSRSARVVAVEIDRRLAGVLERHFAAPGGDRYDPRFRLIVGDALADKSHIAPAVLDAVRPTAHLVSNLPYNIATPLVADCMFESWSSLQRPGVRFDRLTFTVQKEVADRLAATGGGDYGPASVVLALLGRVTLGAVLGAGAFWPPPKIASRIARVDFDAARAGELRDAAVLQKLLRMVFTQRRKFVLSTSRAKNAPWGPDAFAAALEQAAVRPNARAEELAPQEFLRLANVLAGDEHLSLEGEVGPAGPKGPVAAG